MSTKYEEKYFYKQKFKEGTRQVLQGAVLSTAIITGFSTDLGREIEPFFCISRPHSTGWSISA